MRFLELLLFFLGEIRGNKRPVCNPGSMLGVLLPVSDVGEDRDLSCRKAFPQCGSHFGKI